MRVVLRSRGRSGRRLVAEQCMRLLGVPLVREVACPCTVDCSMTVRPERDLLDFRLHEELYYNFELRAVEMATRGECTSMADDEAENLKHNSHIRQHNAGQCRYIIKLIDEIGRAHVSTTITKEKLL